MKEVGDSVHLKSKKKKIVRSLYDLKNLINSFNAILQASKASTNYSFYNFGIYDFNDCGNYYSVIVTSMGKMR